MVILNIKFPQCCSECELFDGEDLCYGDGTYAIGDKNNKPDWCPILGEIEDTQNKMLDQLMLDIKDKEKLDGIIR